MSKHLKKRSNKKKQKKIVVLQSIKQNKNYKDIKYCKTNKILFQLTTRFYKIFGRKNVEQVICEPYCLY